MRFTLCLALTLALTACGTDGNPPRQVDAAVVALDALPDVAPLVDAAGRDAFDVGGAQPCTAGRVEECPCGDGRRGTQTCQPTGVYGACACADAAVVVPDVVTLDVPADAPSDAVDAVPVDDQVDASAAEVGCDAAVETDPANCGACGAACPTRANAAPSCARGLCDITCTSGFADCNRRAMDGCESDMSADVLNCGACGRRCSFEGGTARCVAGQCQLVSCTAFGYRDCDGSGSGCVNTSTSTLHCGGCGRPCNLPNASPRCADGACRIVNCAAGFINCDGNTANGCEINLRTDPMNCGNCGTRCPTGQMCVSGNCFLICPDGQRPCGARCVDTDAGC